MKISPFLLLKCETSTSFFISTIIHINQPTMHHPCCKASVITTAITITCAVDAFIVNPTTARTLLQQPSTRATRFLIRPPLHLTSSSSSSSPRPSSSQLYDTTSNADDAQDNEIVRLKKMAAKLRAEAASLEADKAKQVKCVV
jgi:hypothetical protein